MIDLRKRRLRSALFHLFDRCVFILLWFSYCKNVSCLEFSQTTCIVRLVSGVEQVNSEISFKIKIAFAAKLLFHHQRSYSAN